MDQDENKLTSCEGDEIHRLKDLLHDRNDRIVSLEAQLEVTRVEAEEALELLVLARRHVANHTALWNAIQEHVQRAGKGLK